MASVADNIRNKKPWTSLSSTDKRAAEDAGFNQRSWTAEIGPTNTSPPTSGAADAPSSDMFVKLGKLATERVPKKETTVCLLYTSPSPRDGLLSRMPSSA